MVRKAVNYWFASAKNLHEGAEELEWRRTFTKCTFTKWEMRVAENMYDERSYHIICWYTALLAFHLLRQRQPR